VSDFLSNRILLFSLFFPSFSFHNLFLSLSKVVERNQEREKIIKYDKERERKLRER
jgi:hypothetical protein